MLIRQRDDLRSEIVALHPPIGARCAIADRCGFAGGDERHRDNGDERCKGAGERSKHESAGGGAGRESKQLGTR